MMKIAEHRFERLDVDVGQDAEHSQGVAHHIAPIDEGVAVEGVVDDGHA